MRARKGRKAVKGPWGLKERPKVSPSEDRQEQKDPPASVASLDHEEIKVSKELPVSRGIRASTDP